MKTRNSYFSIIFISSAPKNDPAQHAAEFHSPVGTLLAVRSDIYVPLLGRLTLTAFPNYIFVYAQRQWFSPVLLASQPTDTRRSRRAWPAYCPSRYRGTP